MNSTVFKRNENTQVQRLWKDRIAIRNGWSRIENSLIAKRNKNFSYLPIAKNVPLSIRVKRGGGSNFRVDLENWLFLYTAAQVTY